MGDRGGSERETTGRGGVQIIDSSNDQFPNEFQNQMVDYA